MNYAVDYAQKQKSIGIVWNGDRKPEILITLAGGEFSKDKLDLLEKLGPDDKLFLEFAGGSDKFARAASRKDSQVLRVPTFVFKNFRQENKLGNEIHLALMKMAKKSPESFYPMQKVDEDITHLRFLSRAYWIIQKRIRIPTQLRLSGVYRDLFLLENDIEGVDLESRLKEEFADLPLFQAALNEEKRFEEGIKDCLKQIPVYKEVFVPIKGCGHLIAGRIIGEIVDIKRFPSKHHLKSYARLHHNLDGTVPRREKGKVSSGNDYLRDGVYQFCDQTNRRPDSFWGQKLLKRKQYELDKIFPDMSKVTVKTKGVQKFYSDGVNEIAFGHIHNKAKRYVGQKFLECIYSRWNEFERLQEL